MIVNQIAVHNQNQKIELSAMIQPETPGWLPQKIFFRFPINFADYIQIDGNPFLPALLAPTMVLGERLIIEAPVSNKLLEHSKVIQSIYQKWLKNAKVVAINAETTLENDFPLNAIGCFFSCGVDSFYSLLKNKEQITHLILLRGYDRALKNEMIYKKTVESATLVAKETGKELILVETNIRDFTDKLVNWLYFSGAVLAATGLSFSKLFGKVIIPATESYDYLTPMGTHPLLDPLWSTVSTTFIHDGCELNRSEKITNWVAQSPIALKTLRVCWENTNSNYNCGKCEKCLRTMLTLQATGKLEQCQTFDQPLTLKNVRRLKLRKYYLIGYAKENVTLLLKSNDQFNNKLAKALNYVIKKSILKITFKLLKDKPIK